jgi:hypothetical protein
MVLLSAYDGRTRQRWSEVFCDVPLSWRAEGATQDRVWDESRRFPGIPRGHGTLQSAVIEG